jgi:Eco29kI restriction endonuclease
LPRVSVSIYQRHMPPKPQKPSDPSPQLFNPLDKKQLAASVAEALLSSDIHSLPPEKKFSGAGVYAIYYFGDAPTYRKLAKINKTATCDLQVPIYVGKAIPTGGRKGEVEFDATVGQSLYNRLREHGESIRQTSDLEVRDFKCRYLVVDDIWIPLAESLMIRKFKPIWNVAIDGFGNHAPGAGRYKQQRSPWDALHPGRSWAERLAQSARTRRELLDVIEHKLR